MIYLYGLLTADAPVDRFDLSSLSGVTGPVALAATPQGHLIHGPAPEGDILPKRRFLLAHARVLEDLNELGTLLPMRFGMSAASIEQVGAMLEAEQDAITRSFGRLEGAVELGLRISFPRQAALEAILTEDPVLRADRDRLARGGRQPHFETANLGRRLAEALGRRRDRAQKALLAQIVPLCRDHVLRAPEEDVHVLSVDVLIDRAAQDSFADRVEDIARACAFAPGAEPDIRLVGPVPAYNFVRLMLSVDKDQAA
jgi:hypothetical protein